MSLLDLLLDLAPATLLVLLLWSWRPAPTRPGTHPRMTRAEAMALLPPAPCRNCVYWVRCGQELRRSCTRCGLWPPAPRRLR